MGSVDYRSLAGDIVERVGGVDNIAGATHCATRLRLRLRDEDKADKAAVEKLTGVITVMRAGGQFQVVIGNDVPLVYSELSKITGTTDDTADAAPASGNLLNRFIDLVSSLIQPLLWPIAGAGLFKAFLSLFTQLGWLDPTSQSYTVLAAAADAVFYFLPILLAVTASKRFRADQFTSMAIAGAMLYPSIIAGHQRGGALLRHPAGVDELRQFRHPDPGCRVDPGLPRTRAEEGATQRDP